MPEENLATKTISAGNDDRLLNVQADLSDIRDRYYEPALIELDLSLPPPLPESLTILNQLNEGACTGFALAAVINLQNQRPARAGDPDTPALAGNPDIPRLVSERMLYQMARIHDEWRGEDYSGSSIRGVIKGFYHNGVCSQEKAKYIAGDNDWTLNVDQAKNARHVGLGAYFRLRPDILDYHVALNEVGAIIVSANVHRGWRAPKTKGKVGVINKSSVFEGGHAFAIVGYDAKGFLIQNSWGQEWGMYNGQPGIAHWSYEDWAENIIDAWVLRLSVPTPDAFGLSIKPVRKTTKDGQEEFSFLRPRRYEINGHYIHLDDGELVEQGTYGTSQASIQKTADWLKEPGNSKDYKHLLFYAHGGLNNTKASARRISVMRNIYKRNGIYPIHFMWETGFTEEFGDVFKGIFRRSQERVGSIRDGFDWAIEKFARGLGRRIWNQMKEDARLPFVDGGSGSEAVKRLLDANNELQNPLQVHFVGHSAGSILLAELLAALPDIGHGDLKIKTCNLMAPACTLDFYEKMYRPALGGNGSLLSLYQYNMIDSRELDDTVGPYGKSLLYFISRAFEQEFETKLLGMAAYSKDLQLTDNHKIWYAGHDKSRTKSKSHGGFDNDRTTMNDILTNILGRKPSQKNGFQVNELDKY